MKFKEIENKQETELQRLLAQKREDLREARFKVSNDQLKDVRTVRELRQEIAQILTRLNQLAKKHSK
ncbi:50S ribosomal protein L29 [Patescibacteria group bacterium]